MKALPLSPLIIAVIATLVGGKMIFGMKSIDPSSDVQKEEIIKRHNVNVGKSLFVYCIQTLTIFVNLIILILNLCN